MKKVITYGTFDLFHIGHYNILKRARELGDYLIVGVTSQSYDLERGKLNVKDSLATRIENVRKTGLADEIIIEEYQGQKINDVIQYQVDTLVVGSDWIGKFDYLKKYCNVVYLERTKNISSTQIREKMKIYRIGLATNKATDDSVVIESKYVSGMHVESVFHPQLSCSEALCKEYELNYYTDNYDKFLDSVDIVCIKMENLSDEEYIAYIEKAVQKGKHLICSMVNVGSVEKAKELFQIAYSNKVLICEDLPIGYVRAFEQLIWYIKGGVIGEIVSVNVKISKQIYECGSDDSKEIIYLLMYIMIKIIGSKVSLMNKYKKEEYDFQSFHVITDIGEFTAQIGSNIFSCLEIIGSKGRVYVPDDWWRMGYFKIFTEDPITTNRYSYNFEGTGFKYILMDMQSMLEAERYQSCKVFPEESLKMLELVIRLISD